MIERERKEKNIEKKRASENVHINSDKECNDSTVVVYLTHSLSQYYHIHKQHAAPMQNQLHLAVISVIPHTKLTHTSMTSAPFVNDLFNSPALAR